LFFYSAIFDKQAGMSTTPFDAFIYSEVLGDRVRPPLQLDAGLPLSLFVETVRQSPVAISITDKKANILYVNDAFSAVTGYSQAEIIGENESRLSDKSTPRKVYYELWYTISRKHVWHGRLVNRRKQGERYLADLTITPMLDDKGNISHYIGMHRDVTQDYYAEQQVANQKQLIESVLNASPVAMAVLDSDKRIVMDNQMYKMLISELGYPEPALFFIEVLQQDLGDLWAEPEQQHRRRFNNYEVRVDAVGKRGTRWFACSGNWFSEHETGADYFFNRQSRDYLLLSIHDITQQRHQQEKLYLQSLRTVLAEEEYLRSIRETLLGAMHQIGQPLNQINAALQLMSQRNDNGNKALHDLLLQVHDMGVHTLSTLRRCVPEIPESAMLPVNINQLLHDVIRLYSQKFLANGIVVEWKPNPVLPSVLGADNKLRMLFKLLIDNAIHAMNRSGATDRLVKIGTVSDTQWVVVTIADTGSGIPLKLHSKVFEPFFTLEQNGGMQAGMGLVMAKEIVDQHNGLIAIDPEYQAGCCIGMRFPLCPKSGIMDQSHE
jgi:nitrogen fixation regulatory protein